MIAEYIKGKYMTDCYSAIRLPRTASGGNPNFRHSLSERFGLAGILLSVFLVFAPTLRYQFVYDDDFQILRNSHIQSWEYVRLYFTSHVWSQAFPATQGWNYLPLFLL
jgi:hypothetical protein